MKCLVVGQWGMSDEKTVGKGWAREMDLEQEVNCWGRGRSS